MKTPRIETDRLLLREIQETDVNDIFGCWMQDENVSRYMCWKASYDIAETQSFVRFELEQIENEKWNRWIIVLRETGQIVGTCLVFFNEDDAENHWDISYNLGKKYWGKGYITEAMKAVMQFAEIELGMEECITTYAKVNTASANVLHKLGFIDEAEIPYEYSGGDIITEGILCRYGLQEGDRMSIDETRREFEASFVEAQFYNKQTQDSEHLEKILSAIQIKNDRRILDIGCGSGYLTFPIAKMNQDAQVIGLDIVTNTLKQNEERAEADGLCNLKFVSYDGMTFPFKDASFDLVVSRYALHHFPEIEKSMCEVARVLKPGGRLFISDPRPNDCDHTRFVDDYMQLKKDGHIKFYTKDEWIRICGKYGMHIVDGFDSEIRFPKKKSTAVGFEKVLAKHSKEIIDSYKLTQTEDEIWVTEQVNNLMFEKG